MDDDEAVPRRGIGSIKALGGFEGLAAFQTTCFVARRDKPTKWTHSPRLEIPIARFDAKTPSQRSSHEGTQSANTDKKRMMRDEGHIVHSDDANDDMSPSAGLCKIAHSLHARLITFTRKTGVRLRGSTADCLSIVDVPRAGTATAVLH